MQSRFRRDLIMLGLTPLIAALALMLSRLHRQLPHTQAATFLLICVAAVGMWLSYRRCGAMVSAGGAPPLGAADPHGDVISLSRASD